MSNRAKDWLAQAEHDLKHARHSLEDADYDWTCFAAHQAAEKAVKALYLFLGGEGWGHTVTRLLTDLSNRSSISDDLIFAARRLDKHYLPTRYPNGFDAGSPQDYYTIEEAQRAIHDAECIYDFCHRSVHRSESGR